MTDQEIIDTYNEDLEMTIENLSRISGRSRQELKELLNGPV
tara:strand:+ start:405 stop:527 length:123 start_codon:yes stop_codon:yes gene_type:complete